MTVLERLGDARRIRRRLDLLAARQQWTNRRTPSEVDPSLGYMFFRGPEFARRLARDIRSGAYRPAPVRLRRAQLEKPRDLYVFRPVDLIVQGVFAELLTEAMEPALPERLYSYRKSFSSWIAVRDFAAYVREHRRAFREPREYLPRDGWYRQFDGERLTDDLVLKRRIRPITGATLTAGATTAAVRRVLAIHAAVHFGDQP